MNKTAVVTIASKNYFAQVQTLLKSLQETNPHWDRFFGVVDEPDNQLMDALKVTDTKLVKMDEIGIPDLDDMKFRYDIMELNTAIKPFVLLRLLEDYDRVVYLDPDIRVYEKMQAVDDAFDKGYEFVVTPHFTGYWEEDGKHPTEPDILMAGTYNFGFFAAAKCEAAIQIISWWAKKLEKQCIVKQEEGIFVDQKWMDLLPARHDKVFILRDEGYNIAYWNLSHREATYEDGKFFFNGCPLVFFHFSGFNPTKMDIVSKHQNRFTMDDIGVAKKLFFDYAKCIFDNRYKEWQKVPYSYENFSDGRKIHNIFRYIFREFEEVRELVGGKNPFLCGDIFYEEKEKLAPHIINYTVMTQRNLAGYFLNTQRKDWAEVFNNTFITGYKLDDEWATYAMNFVQRHLAHFTGEKVEPIHSAVSELRNVQLKDGVNVIGYIKSEHGVGEACRLTANALETTSVDWDAYDFEINNPSRQTDHTYDAKIKRSITHNISIFNINADQLPVAKEHLPAAAWDGYRIGIWYWELTEFPEQWCGAFNLVDEIWAPTKFIRDNLMKKSTVPVIYMPPGIRRDEPKEMYNRNYFKLPENTFLYLNFFDAFSYTSRKNPSAAIKAFQMAFSPDDMSVGLVLKINNVSKDDESVKAIEKAISGYKNIYIIAKTMTREEINGLINVCDVSVSLHRSEGLGLLCEESMYFGKPVIATNWSGSTDFMTEDSACLVDYTMVPIGEYYGTNEPNQFWAEPDVLHASNYMVRLHEDKEYYEKISRNAKEYIRTNFSPEVCGQRMEKRINEILAKKASWIERNIEQPAPMPQYNYRTGMESIQEDRQRINSAWNLSGIYDAACDILSTQSVDQARLDQELTEVNNRYGIGFHNPIQASGILAPFKKLFKKIVRKMNGFLFAPIIAFNESTTRTMNELRNQNVMLKMEVLKLQAEQINYNASVNRILNELSAQAENAVAELEQLRVVDRQIKNQNMKQEMKINATAGQVNAQADAVNVGIAELNAGIANLKTELENLSRADAENAGMAEHYYQAAGSLYNAMYQRVTSIDRILSGQNENDSVSMEKEFIENKWKLIDKYYNEPQTMECNICGQEIHTNEAEKLLSEDIYGGGMLLRYRCPHCGAIVGPNKMWDLTEEELSEEYKYHYRVNAEGQTTEAEIETFMALNPEKGKTYLNYGCGAWASTIEELRKLGYDVYGFDPYAPCDSEYIITDFDVLKQKKFDGIFSHDLLEHLRYPVETFKVFSEILAEDGKMAHSTACYKYVYEYDRFHLVFYTGNAVNALCERTGFVLAEKIEDNDRLTYNYIYTRK